MHKPLTEAELQARIEKAIRDTVSTNGTGKDYRPLDPELERLIQGGDTGLEMSHATDEGERE